ncbi:MAG: PUR family DNA/RNA-binding protein [Treponema sp.]|nr:PUR family DNA/RNA-binding protein [Treponema sp.]
MGARGELFTTQVYLDNRSYFFNVKENRTGDVFLQIVESKNRDGAEADRHQIAVFSEDMQKFLQGMEKSLDFIEKNRKAKQKAAREKKAAKDAKYGHGTEKGSEAGSKKIYKMKKDGSTATPSDGIKRTGRIHVVSKLPTEPKED